MHGIFPPDMGLTEGEVEAHFAVTAFQAKENYVNRGAPRKLEIEFCIGGEIPSVKYSNNDNIHEFFFSKLQFNMYILW